MATKVIRSASNQPIYLNLSGGRSLKIPARQTVEISDADLASAEVDFFRKRGSIVVLDKPKEGKQAKEKKAKEAGTSSKMFDKLKGGR